MSEYTPTTDEMRSMILEFGELIAVSRHEPEYRDRLITEFDRWLAEVKAEAWDEGFTEGLGDGCSCDGCLKWVSNPYRELGKSGNDFQAKVGIEETE